MAKKYVLIFVVLFIVVLAAVFFITYQFAFKTSIERRQEQTNTSVIASDKNQQVRRVVFKNIETEETVELFADGTVNYYDKQGKLTKSGRRGFAETQSLLKDLERLLNSGQPIAGYKGYQLTIETEQGVIVVNPGQGGNGGTVIDDVLDYIDETLNPTPRPSPRVTPSPSTNPYASPSPTPTEQVEPTPTPSVEPFTCDDYYKSGKPMRITNIICGPNESP